MKTITTASGAQYSVVVKDTGNGPCIFVKKAGMSSAVPVVGIFKDRLPFLEATKAVKYDTSTQKCVGWNDKGIVTLRFDPLQIKPGMILANRRGFRSTTIVQIQ